MSGFAPHDCVQCGEPCYIPFGLPPRCTNEVCMHFDSATALGHRVEVATALTADWDDDATDPIGYSITEREFDGDIAWTVPGVSKPPYVPPTQDLYRDFCTHCHASADFHRRLDAQSGSHYGFCPHCGHPNIWTTP